LKKAGRVVRVTISTILPGGRVVCGDDFLLYESFTDANSDRLAA